MKSNRKYLLLNILLVLAILIFFGMQINRDIPQYFEKIEHKFTFHDLEGSIYLYKFPTEAYHFQLKHSDQPKKVKTWFEDHENALLVINGFYFHKNNQPSGYFISEGARVGEQQFDLDKSGVVNFNPNLQIIDSKVQNIDLNSLQTAAQSYPFFIKNGQPAIAEDSGLKARRSFIGQDLSGYSYIGVLPSLPISLYQLMNILQEMPISWQNAINLDGGPSTGLVAKIDPQKTDTFNSLVAVPNVIIICPKTDNTSC